MRRANKRLPRLGDLETAVLKYLWKVDETDVLEAYRVIGSARGITSNTVGSALERLHKKGLVVREKVSHAYRYRPALTHESFAAQRMLEAVGGSGALVEAGLLSAFVDLVSDEDRSALDHLEALIAQKRGRRGKG